MSISVSTVPLLPQGLYSGPAGPEDPRSRRVTGLQSHVHHCHIVEHQDNEMMRPFTLIP